MSESNPFHIGDQLLIMHDQEQVVRRLLGELDRAGFVQAFWAKDARLWKRESGDPTIIGAMGWLDVAQKMKSAVPELEAFAKEIRDAGFERVILAGMGG